jgi:hypothetical protein
MKPAIELIEVVEHAQSPEIRDSAKAALAQRIEQLEKDAARYRFISAGFTPMGLDMSGNHPWVCRVSPSRLKGPTLDAAIDSAMKGETP